MAASIDAVVGTPRWSTKIRWATVASFGHSRMRQPRAASSAVRTAEPFTSETVVGSTTERRLGPRIVRSIVDGLELIGRGGPGVTPLLLAWARHDPRPLRPRPGRAGAARPSASPPPVTGCTSSAARCATCWSMRAGGDFDLDLTTDARPDEIKALPRRVGRRGVDPGRAVRHDRGPLSARSHVSRSRRSAAESYTDDSRKPDVTFADDIETDLARRDFTDQRDGARAHGRRGTPRWSTRTAARPTCAAGRCARRSGPRSASATTRCGCCARPGSSPASA